MTHRKAKKTGFYSHVLYGILLCSLSATVFAQESREALLAEIEMLKAKLEKAEMKLANHGSDAGGENSEDSPNTPVNDDILRPSLAEP